MHFQLRPSSRLAPSPPPGVPEYKPTGAPAPADIACRFTVSQACVAGRPRACRRQLLPPFTERYTAAFPPGETRGQTFDPSIGNTQSVSGSRGCTTIGKPIEPTLLGIVAPMSCQRSP